MEQAQNIDCFVVTTEFLQRMYSTVYWCRAVYGLYWLSVTHVENNSSDMHCFSIRCMPSRQFYNVYESIWNTITLHDSGVKLFPNYLHIHVASGFNSKTTELAKNTIARWNESSSVSRLMMTILIDLLFPFILEDYILASSRWRVKLNFHSDHSDWVGHTQPPERDWTGAESGTKTNQWIKPRCWSGQDHSPNSKEPRTLLTAQHMFPFWSDNLTAEHPPTTVPV